MPSCCAAARDVVFFMHGILDTSIGWVANGVTGSQAFAAYDAGFDVWLGNSRANPPIDHIGDTPSQSATLSDTLHLLRRLSGMIGWHSTLPARPLSAPSLHAAHS